MRWLASPVLLVALAAMPPALAAESPICRLFTQKEAAAHVGAAVADGEAGLVPGAQGCSWSDEATGNKLSITVFPAGNALQLKAWGFESWEGFRAVPGIGSRAYVARSPLMEIMGRTRGGEWQAGSVVGDDYLTVAVKGPKAGADAAIALLKEAIGRRR